MRHFLLVLLFTIAACDQTTDTPASQTTDAVAIDCLASNRLTPYCGFRNPEDLALTPDRKALLVSEMG